MLGTRATAQGLVLDPCIPAEWKEYKVDRRFGSARYRITVLNPEGTGKGVAQVLVDGKEWQEDILPYEEGRDYEVIVHLGHTS
ncbi:N,N'-diacetylchitobiose phosphorylase [compost metagenome]